MKSQRLLGLSALLLYSLAALGIELPTDLAKAV